MRPASSPSLHRIPEVASLREAELAAGRHRAYAEELGGRHQATAFIVGDIPEAVMGVQSEDHNRRFINTPKPVAAYFNEYTSWQ